MANLKTISQQQKEVHHATLMRSIEQAIVESAISCGIDPREINLGSHPLPNIDEMDKFELRLAEKVHQYKLLSK